MKQFLLLMLAIAATLTKAQNSNADTTISSTNTVSADDNITINRRFNQLYLINFPVSYAVPFAELDAPVKNWYVLNSDIRVPFNLLPSYKRVALVAVARFKVRIIGNQYSLPVRTPSFMPGGILFIRLNNDINKFKYLSVDVFHHSNGQDAPAVNTPGTDDINLYNGNFSTNFLAINYHWGKVCNYRLISQKIGFEAHKLDEKSFSKYFGQARINYSLQLSGNIIRFLTFTKKVDANTVRTSQIQNDEELWRIVINATAMLNNLHAPSIGNYFNLECMAIRKIGSSPNAGFFVGVGYTGHDDYNVYFRQKYIYARAGLVFTPGFRYGLTTLTTRGKKEPYLTKRK